MCHLSKDLAPPTLQNGGLSHERPKPRWCTLWPPRLSVHHGKVAHLARTCTSGDATPVLALWRGRTTRQPRASEEKPPSWCSGGGRCGRTVLVSAKGRVGRTIGRRITWYCRKDSIPPISATVWALCRPHSPSECNHPPPPPGRRVPGREPGNFEVSTGSIGNLPQIADGRA